MVVLIRTCRHLRSKGMVWEREEEVDWFWEFWEREREEEMDEFKNFGELTKIF